MCISIHFNVCLFYTCIIGNLILVALHKKKKRESVLRPTLGPCYPFFSSYFASMLPSIVRE
jgi:hypothetical protein